MIFDDPDAEIETVNITQHNGFNRLNHQCRKMKQKNQNKKFSAG